MAKISFSKIDTCPHNDEHPIWLTGDDEEIAICQLTPQHLDAIIRMLINGVEAAWSMLSSLNGDMAQYYAEQDVWYCESWLEDLLAERKRRESIR